MSNLVKRARLAAIKWHNSIGQKRKYTGEPYWHHPEAVAKIVKSVPHTEEMIAIAYLHDVIEDTPASYENVLEQFGEHIADGVKGLTDEFTSSNYPMLRRAERKVREANRLAKQPRFVKTIKLADLIDNSSSILQHDRSFAEVYLVEKRRLLDEALKAGDAKLWARADKIVSEGLATFG